MRAWPRAWEPPAKAYRLIRQTKQSGQIDQKHVRARQLALYPRTAPQNLRRAGLQQLEKLALLVYDLPDAAPPVGLNAELAQLDQFHLDLKVRSVRTFRTTANKAECHARGPVEPCFRPA